MPTHLPIACSLNASDLANRMTEMAAIGEAALTDVTVDGALAVLRFRSHGETRSRLARVVAAEAQCCAFLEMQLSEDGNAVTLTIMAPSGAEPVLAELVDAFGGRSQAA